jgi:hypothetical protein
MGMPTVPAIYSDDDRVNALNKLGRQFAGLTRSGKELGSYLSRDRAILLYQVQRKLALPSPEDQARRDARADTFLLRPQFMPHDQEFVRVLNADGLNAHEGRGNYDRVVSIRCQGIWPNKPWQPLTALSTEAHVMTEFLGRSPRLTATEDMTFGRLLEFDCHAWATVNAGRAKALHRRRRECQAQ